MSQNPTWDDDSLHRPGAEEPNSERVIPAPPSAGSALPAGGALRLCKEPFEADRRDAVFALLTFVLGYFFVRWFLLSWQGWGVSAFTAGYCAAVTLYLIKKEVRIPRAGWFWLAVVMLVGISYSFYSNSGLEPWRGLFLFCAAIYFVLCATRQLILGATSNWLFLDGINGVFVIPFSNIGCQYKSLAYFKLKKRIRGRQALSIALGALLALIVIGAVLPLLLRADSGGFAKIADSVYRVFLLIQERFLGNITSCILAIPVAAYIFGLVGGAAHQKGCRTFKRESLEQTARAVRALPSATVYTLLGLLCLLYLAFIGSQLPYYFSAFSGRIPDGWRIYSEYARSGFFELCQISVINLALLAGANLFCKKPERDSAVLKALNCALSLLTILLIATAFSKMVLYIRVYGLSIRRLLPCLFMVFLAVVFCGVIALQKWRFSILRLSAFTGAGMLCALCLLNPDGFVARYNAGRYLAGTLSDFDVQILYQAGAAGIGPAIQVYGRTADEGLKSELKVYIEDVRQTADEIFGTAGDNVQNLLARKKINGVPALASAD